MEFKDFKNLFQQHVEKMLEGQDTLYITDVDKDNLWNLYLDSYPPGTNEIFRERREHDCSCCRHFIRSFGNIVVIRNNKPESIWRFNTGDITYQTVVDALADLIESSLICDVFVTKESVFGTDFNHERMEDGTVHTWPHFWIKLPEKFATKSNKTEATLMGQYRDVKSVFQRSLEEISLDSIETVLDLIAQKSLYKGDEWQSVLTKFLTLHDEYRKLPVIEKALYCWSTSVEVGGVIGKIRNHSIGVLLIDITNGVDINEAVRKYEAIVAPTNYKRPKAIFTKKMITQAQETIKELGLLDSLSRRHAVIDDITVNNILFANRDSIKRMTGDVFSELEQEVVADPKGFDKVEEVSIDHFLENILPRTTGLEVYLENRHTPNLVSVIAPGGNGSKTMFKWNNNFSWAYNGNITDSMKERVRKAGGNVEGILRFSIQWNDGKTPNFNDFDAHCVEPDRNHIYFQSKGQEHPSSGMLDVDIVSPIPHEAAVENITWTRKDKMQEGLYMLYVHNYSHNGGRSGFSAEIEYDGQIHQYEYNKELRQDEKVKVAKLEFTREGGVKFIESLPSTTASKQVWSLQTNQFHPVSVCMFSPNYWDEQKGIGHRHYFFIMTGCKNEDQPNGFFNEFLKEDLMKHKRVFEALGGKMKVPQSSNQLSGLGFSSTKRNTLTCKVEGHITRTLKMVM